MAFKQAPDFTLKDQNGNYFTLSENIDNYVMLVFYPKDETPICTKQLCDYNSSYESFTEKGIKVIGISVDSVESHFEFSKKHNFSFPILSDVTKEISRQYNALNLFGYSKRKIVLIDNAMNIVHENKMLPIFYKKAGDLIKMDILKNL